MRAAQQRPQVLPDALRARDSTIASELHRKAQTSCTKLCNCSPWWLERQEEALIAAAAKAGQDILRRADASPAAVLERYPNGRNRLGDSRID